MQLFLLANMMIGKRKIPNLLQNVIDSDIVINKTVREGLVSKYCDSVIVRRKKGNTFIVLMKRGSYAFSFLTELHFRHATILPFTRTLETREERRRQNASTEENSLSV